MEVVNARLLSFSACLDPWTLILSVLSLCGATEFVYYCSLLLTYFSDKIIFNPLPVTGDPGVDSWYSLGTRPMSSSKRYNPNNHKRTYVIWSGNQWTSTVTLDRQKDILKDEILCFTSQPPFPLFPPAQIWFSTLNKFWQRDHQVNECNWDTYLIYFENVLTPTFFHFLTHWSWLIRGTSNFCCLEVGAIEILLSTVTL